jgi:uncharacterized protein (DUF433 family)
MSPVPTKYEHLAPHPKSAYRQLFIKGPRIRAWGIDCDHVAQNGAPEKIAADRDLPVEAVREAIAYCASNPPEVRGDLIREEEEMRAAGMFEPAYKVNPTPRILSPEARARIHRMTDPIPCGCILTKTLHRAISCER